MALTFEESVHEGFKEFKSMFAEVGKTQQLLGDYMDSEFKKVLDNQAKIKMNSTITAVATVAVAGIGTLAMVYHYGGGGQQQPVMTMQPARAGKLA